MCVCVCVCVCVRGEGKCYVLHVKNVGIACVYVGNMYVCMYVGNVSVCMCGE